MIDLKSKLEIENTTHLKFEDGLSEFQASVE